jgi:methylthioribose-1-phosphate isomerase
MTNLQAIKFDGTTLTLLDQRELPHRASWIRYETPLDVAVAIETMVVRGAPAIGCAAAFGLTLGLGRTTKVEHKGFWGDYQKAFARDCDRMWGSRRTAVNLSKFPADLPIDRAHHELVAVAMALFEQDLDTCRTIGDFGADFIRNRFQAKVKVLTHCNAGALATAGYGTALGVVRSLSRLGLIDDVIVDETRPYLQGSRLTAYELETEGIPYHISVDSAAAHLMSKGLVDLVIVGADRITKNGDTANKIGTYSLAINAKHHKIPFYVAAPNSTIDPRLESGEQIVIEERNQEEVTCFQGHRVTPKSKTQKQVRNPSFDVTPSELISAIFTESGISQRPYDFQDVLA